MISKRFLHRSVFLILAIIFIGFSGYFFIDWRFLWPAPSLSLTKNQEGFYETSFPSKIALAAYARDYLYDYFLTNQTSKLRFTSSPRIDFYDRLTSDGKRKFNRHLKLPEGQEKQTLENYLIAYSNVVLQIDQDSITISDPIGNSLVEQWNSAARGKMATLMLLDKKQGLFFQAPFLAYRAYLVRINSKNLRAFSVSAKGQIDDKSYPQICRALVQVKSKDFYSYLMRLLVEGYQPDLFSGLTTLEQELLVDIGGIYLAEVWRMKSMNLKKDILQILPEACLLSLYFNSGGRFYPSEKIEPKLQSYQSCRHLTLPHRNFVLYVEPHDKAISAYLKGKRPLLYFQLQWLAPGEPDRLLRNLSRYLDNPTYHSYYSQWLIDQLIKILQEEAKEV